MKNQTFLAVLLLVGCGVAAVATFSLDKPDLGISFTETDDDVTVLAIFPDDDSDRVQQYVRDKLKMTDLSDFSDIEIKHYDTPDQTMHLHIKSEEGYLKIGLDKDKNTSSARRRLRDTCDGLKNLLTQR